MEFCYLLFAICYLLFAICYLLKSLERIGIEIQARLNPYLDSQTSKGIHKNF